MTVRIPAERAPVGDVTVVMPTIPGRDSLRERALASVRAQTLQPLETIVVTDRTRLGAAWARNLGAAQVTTTWLAWLDDDDEFLPHHLETLLAATQVADPTPDLVYACMEVVGGRDPTAVAQDGQWVNPCGVPFGHEQEQHLRYQGNFIPVTYLVRAQLVREVGGMPPSGGRGYEEDYQLLLRLLNVGARFLHVPQVTWRYHFHQANTGGGVQGTGASNREAFQ